MENIAARLIKGRTGLWVPQSTNDKSPILVGKAEVPLELFHHCTDKGYVKYNRDTDRHVIEFSLCYWEATQRCPKTPSYKGEVSHYDADSFRQATWIRDQVSR